MMKRALLSLLCCAAPGSAALALPAWESLPAEPAARAEALREVAGKVLEEEAEPMSAASDCAAFSQLWLEKLNFGAGYRLVYAETAGMGDVALAGGGTVRRDKTHYFLADRTACGSAEPCEDEIIIDPTYMQFLAQGECLYGASGAACAGAEELSALPRVLVGTRAEIKAFYSGLSGRVRLYSEGTDPESGKYAGASAASLIYSFGPNSPLRYNMELFPRGRAAAGRPAGDDGAEALARIKRAAEAAVRAQRPYLEAEVNEVKAALAAEPSITTDPEDPATARVMAPFLDLYLRFTHSALPYISERDERDYASGFFEEFFMPEDNRPEHVSVLSGYLSALSAHRLRTGYNYTVGTMTGGGDDAFGKGGELLIMAGEYALRPRDEAAAVLAHELQHNEHRHYIQYQVVAAVNKLLAEETAGASEGTGRLADNYYRWLCEYQADAAAAEIMRKAGFDPRGLKAVLAGLPEGERDLRSDHPPASLRLARLDAGGSREESR